MPRRPVREQEQNGTVGRLNQALGTELNALESYTTVVQRLQPGQDAGSRELVRHLRQLRGRHQEHILRLRDEITHLGGRPTRDSGVWGVWSRAMMETASRFGDMAMLKALKEGEEQGLIEHRQHLEHLDGEPAEILRRELIPAVRRNIDQLEEILERQQPQWHVD